MFRIHKWEGGVAGEETLRVVYLAVVFVLETTLIQPLQSTANFGQFGIVLIYLGFFGAIFGGSFSLIPYTGFLLWLPAFVAITIALFIMGSGLILRPDPNEVTCAAMLIIGGLIVVLVLIAAALLPVRGR
ncbi:MAG: hypothetical protein AAF802_27370 [Planctomycetota bacterium]